MKQHHFLDSTLRVLCCCSKFPRAKQKSRSSTDCYLEAASNLEGNMQKEKSFSLCCSTKPSHQEQGDGRSTGGQHKGTELRGEARL